MRDKLINASETQKRIADLCRKFNISYGDESSGGFGAELAKITETVPAVISADEVKKRFEVIKAMYTIMKCFNDESVYFEWINVAEDGADDDAMLASAMNDEILSEHWKMFKEIIKDFDDDSLDLWFGGNKTF